MVILLFRIASLLDGFDVLMDGGISADAILVHSSNKVCFREKFWWNSLGILKFDNSGLKGVINF